MKTITTKYPINAKRIDKLEAALAEEQARCTAHTISAQEILDKLEEIDKYVGISKASMVGVKVECDLNAQSFPSAYKYTPESTWFKAERRASGWFITDISRYRTASPTVGTHIILTDTAKQAVMDRMAYMA